MSRLTSLRAEYEPKMLMAVLEIPIITEDTNKLLVLLKRAPPTTVPEERAYSVYRYFLTSSGEWRCSCDWVDASLLTCFDHIRRDDDLVKLGHLLSR